MKEIKIDVGCGLAKRAGFTGVDKIITVKPDIVADIECGLPIKSNSVSFLYSSHTMEHVVNFISLMEEIYRVCKPGAIVEIVVPYYASSGAHMDPTHVRFFTEETFRCCFSKSRKSGRHDYGFRCNFEQIEVKYTYLPQFKFLPFRRIFGHLLLNVITELTFKLRVVKD